MSLPAERARGLISPRRFDHFRAHGRRDGAAWPARMVWMASSNAATRASVPLICQLLECGVPHHQVDEGRSDLRCPREQSRLAIWLLRQ